MEKHYICRGECKGVSNTPGTCQAGGCRDYQKPLKECECEDGQHDKAKEQEVEE